MRKKFTKGDPITTVARVRELQGKKEARLVFQHTPQYPEHSIIAAKLEKISDEKVAEWIEEGRLYELKKL